MKSINEDTQKHLAQKTQEAHQLKNEATTKLLQIQREVDIKNKSSQKDLTSISKKIGEVALQLEHLAEVTGGRNRGL